MSDLPDFLIIGAARSGTTALHDYLRQHPGIFMPALKEPNFFAYEGTTPRCRGPGAEFINNSLTDQAAYRALFAPAPPGAVCGEASPLYLYSPRAPGRIARRLPRARLIAILRNPVEQAFSHFTYATRLAIEPETDFLRALELEQERLAAGWQPLFGYSSFPRYGEQLERYFALFPRSQILIRTYEEFRDRPQQLMREIFAFLGVDAGFRPDMSRRPNAGGVPRNRALQDFLMRPNPVTGAIARLLPQKLSRTIRDRLAAANTRPAPQMPPDARAILAERLRDDIERLQALLRRDLSHWLAPPAS